MEEQLGKNPNSDVSTITFRENSSGEGIVILDPVRDDEFLKETLGSIAGKLHEIDVQSKKNRVALQSIWGINAKGTPELLYGEDDFSEELLGFNFKISPLAFC